MSEIVRTGAGGARSRCASTTARPVGRIVLAATAIGAAFAATPGTAAAQDWRTVTGMRQFAGEERLEVDLEYGAGVLSIEPGDPGVLYRARLRYDARIFDPEMEYRNGRLRVGLDGRRGIDLRSHEGGRLELAIGPEVPVDLEMAFGAVQAEAELGGLRIRSLEVATGASQTTLRFSRPNAERMRIVRLEVGAAEFEAAGLGNANAERLELDGGVGDVVLDFTGEWQGDMAVEVDMGLGGLTLRLPRGLAVRVTKNSFLASFDGQGLIKRGDSYFSENWDGATHRLTINVDAALSDIDVDWVGPVTAQRRSATGTHP